MGEDKNSTTAQEKLTFSSYRQENSCFHPADQFKEKLDKILTRIHYSETNKKEIQIIGWPLFFSFFSFYFPPAAVPIPCQMATLA